MTAAHAVGAVVKRASVAPEIKQFQAAIVSRLKILAKLDIAEKRVPQDGRTEIHFNKLSERDTKLIST